MSVILVTRPAGAADPLVSELEARGFSVRAVPTVVTSRRTLEWPDLSRYDWVAVTSATAVSTLPEIHHALKWAAVGGATAAALRARGIEPDVVPHDANAASLAEAIPRVEGAHVLFIRGSHAGDDLPRGLRARGASVDELTTYDMVEGPDSSRDALRKALSAGDVVAVVFASGSAVRGFVKLGGPGHIPAVTIGPRTTAIARAEGFEVAAEASGQTAAELVAAVERAISSEVRRDA